MGKGGSLRRSEINACGQVSDAGGHVGWGRLSASVCGHVARAIEGWARHAVQSAECTVQSCIGLVSGRGSKSVLRSQSVIV